MELIKNETYPSFIKYTAENIPVLVDLRASSLFQREKEKLLKFLSRKLREHSHGNKSFHAATVALPVEACSAKESRTSSYGASRTQMELSQFLHDAVLEGRDDFYAKDWHIEKTCCGDNHIDTTSPACFLNDWLNWYWKHCRGGEDDYAFVYMGGKNTYTAVHHDVLCSYSWSLNLTGRKRWILWPPSSAFALFPCSSSSNKDRDSNKEGDINETPVNVKNTHSSSSDCSSSSSCGISGSSRNSGSSIRNSSGSSSGTSSSRASNYHRTNNKETTKKIKYGTETIADARAGSYDTAIYPHLESAERIEFIQEPGYAVFVPSGWYHQVENLGGDDDQTVDNGSRDDDKLPTKHNPTVPTNNNNSENISNQENDDENTSRVLNHLIRSKLTISLNKNWFNEFSIAEVWRFLLREFYAVRRELRHLRDPDHDHNHRTSAAGTDTTSTTSGGITMMMASGASSSAAPTATMKTIKAKRNSNQCGGIYTNDNDDDYVPSMSEIEWHSHCETILRANAAFGLKSFIELLAARTLMMMVCTSATHTLNTPASSSTHTPITPSTVSSHGHTSPLPSSFKVPIWAAVLCPSYSIDKVTDEDMAVCRQQKDVAVLLHTLLLRDSASATPAYQYTNDNNKNFLSTYCDGDDMMMMMPPTSSSPMSVTVCDAITTAGGAVSVPPVGVSMTVWTYACHRMIAIVDEVMNNEEVRTHLQYAIAVPCAADDHQELEQEQEEEHEEENYATTPTHHDDTIIANPIMICTATNGDDDTSSSGKNVVVLSSLLSLRTSLQELASSSH